jgi:quercetin dioxygenase-like cupin family protein
MAQIHFMKTRDIPFKQDDRFPSIKTKLLESRQTHAYASVIIAQIAPGGEIPRHVHAVESETAYILSGRGKLIADDVEYAFEPGVMVTIPAGLAHGVVNDSGEPLEIFAFHTPPAR